MSNYYEKTRDGHCDWRENEENVYYRFIVNNFGNIHLRGCRFLAEACELYASGEHSAMLIYEEIAKKCNSTRKAVERCIRSYVDRIDKSTIVELLPSVNYVTSKAVMAGIVYVVSRGGHHEDNQDSV